MIVINELLYDHWLGMIKNVNYIQTNTRGGE